MSENSHQFVITEADEIALRHVMRAARGIGHLLLEPDGSRFMPEVPKEDWAGILFCISELGERVLENGQALSINQAA